MIFPEFNWNTPPSGALYPGFPDPFAYNVPPQGTLPPMTSDPFATSGPLTPPVSANEPQIYSNDESSPLDPVGGSGMSFDSDKFLKALGGLKAPTAPTPQAPPRAPDAPKAGAIPGGLQQLLALLGGGGAPQIPGMRL